MSYSVDGMSATSVAIWLTVADDEAMLTLTLAHPDGLTAQEMDEQFEPEGLVTDWSRITGAIDRGVLQWGTRADGAQVLRPTFHQWLLHTKEQGL